MNKPYFLERWKIARAQSEDRRDPEDIEGEEVKDNEQTENPSETVEV